MGENLTLSLQSKDQVAVIEARCTCAESSPLSPPSHETQRLNRFNSKSRRVTSVHKVSNSNECCFNLPRLSKLIDVITEGFYYISQVQRIRTTEKQIATKSLPNKRKRDTENIKRDINVDEMGTDYTFFKTVPEDDVVGGSVEGDG